LNHAIEAWPIDQFKSLLLSRKKGAGHTFHIFHHLERLSEGNIVLLDRKDGKIDKKSEVTDLSILLFHFF